LPYLWNKTRYGVVHENLKAALMVRMKSGESGADLLASMKSDEGDEPTPQPAKIDDTQVHIYGDTGVVIAGGDIQKPRQRMNDLGLLTR
jgi:hypothetical protein